MDLMDNINLIIINVILYINISNENLEFSVLIYISSNYPFIILLFNFPNAKREQRKFLMGNLMPLSQII